MFDFALILFYSKLMSMAATPPKKNQSAEEALLREAKRLFASKGFDGTTVREIADAAKVNLSLVSYHYGGKEGLYRACIEGFAKERLSATERLLKPAASREELRLRLEMVIEEIVEAQMRDPETALMVVHEAESGAPRAMDILQATMINVARAFTMFFIAAQEKGLVKQQLDPLFLTQLIQGSINTFVRTDFIRSRQFGGRSLAHPEERAKLVENLMSVLFGGIAA